NINECQSSRVERDGKAAQRGIRRRWKTRDHRGAISSGKFWPERSGEIYWPIISAGSHRRRLRIQDEHAPAPIAETEGQKISGDGGVLRNISQRRRLRANECQLR